MIGDEIEVTSKWKPKVLILVAIISLSLLVYPAIKDDLPYLQTLKTARQLITFLVNMRTEAILKNTPMEVRFSLPDTIELFNVSSCGQQATIKKISETSLSKWRAGVEFLAKQDKERAQSRYCYDPKSGSSLVADGLKEGFIFLAHHLDMAAGKLDRFVEISITGPEGNLELGTP